jgi:hypothetical protein
MDERKPAESVDPEPRPFRVRLPGFLKEVEEVGLGDAIKHVTIGMGFTPCGNCKKRASALNRRVVFSR